MVWDNICNKCGKINPNDAQFCIYCGNNLAQMRHSRNICLHCGNILPEGTKFCNFCGKQVQQQSPVQHQQIPVRSGLFNDGSFGSNTQQNYDQRNVVTQDMENYYREQEQRSNKKRPPKVKKQRVAREPGLGYNPVYIPVGLFGIVVISAFIVTWQITVFLAVIAVISLFYIKKKNAEKRRYGLM